MELSAAPLAEGVSSPSDATVVTAPLNLTPQEAEQPRRYPPITIKIATTRAEREAAFRLVYQRYLGSGLCQPNPYGMRVTPYHLLHTTTVFVAIYQGEVIFTMSLIGDGEYGVPLESTFPEEIAQLRRQGITFGEVSCLADRRRNIGRFLPLFTRVSRMVLQFARAHGIQRLVIAVHPKHGPFYKRLFGFQQMSDTRPYGSVLNNPAVAYSLDYSSFSPDRHELYFGEAIPSNELEPQPLTSDELADFGRAAIPLGATELLSGGYEFAQPDNETDPDSTQLDKPGSGQQP